MPQRPPDFLPAHTSLASPASLSPAASASRHVVFARCLSPLSPRSRTPADHHGHPGADPWPSWPLWLTACHQLTPHLQRLGHDSALLDLGPCADDEALAVVRALITGLSSQRITLRAAIAPSGTLAQLALVHLLQSSNISAHQPLALVTAAEIPDLLRRLPITALTRLQFADPTSFPPTSPKTLAQAVSRLEDYGAHTLAHLARLDANDLRRQFGVRLGSLLAAIARGEDVLPFQPTPAPLRLRFRLRLASPITTDRLPLGLPPFACEVASRLARRGLHAHTLELRLRWESGTQESATSATITRTLPQPIAGGRALAETLERMLAALVQPNTHPDYTVSASLASPAIEDVRLIVSHLLPRYPAQHAFWPQRTRRLAATRELADLLARRHGKPLLFHSALTAPDAIFDQDRSRLEPLAADLADLADVAEGAGHPARPAADVADIATGTTDTTDTGADSTPIPHGIHWW